jgi:hypothetical protein
MFHIIAVLLAVLVSLAVFCGTAMASARIQRHQFEEQIRESLEKKISTKSPDRINTAPTPGPEDPAPVRRPSRDPVAHRTPVLR